MWENYKYKRSDAWLFILTFREKIEKSLESAAKKGNAQTFKYLLDESKVGTEKLSKLIQLCSMKGNAECVQVLLDEGADPTQLTKDKQDNTDPENDRNCLDLAIYHSHKYVHALSKYSTVFSKPLEFSPHIQNFKTVVVVVAVVSLVVRVSTTLIKL